MASKLRKKKIVDNSGDQNVKNLPENEEVEDQEVDGEEELEEGEEDSEVEDNEENEGEDSEDDSEEDGEEASSNEESPTVTPESTPAPASKEDSGITVNTSTKTSGDKPVRIKPNRDIRTFIGSTWYDLKKGKEEPVPFSVKQKLQTAGWIDPL